MVSDALILDVQGVGYEVFVPAHLLTVPHPDQDQTWHTYMVIREDAHLLFGFENLEDREVFALLLSVSGVGPKTALGVMNHGHQAVVQAVQQANVAFFQAVPRLGKKLAQKIILELQSKVGEHGSLSFAPLSANLRDIETALSQMGLPADQVAEALRQLDPEVGVSEGIRQALQILRAPNQGGRHAS